MSGWKNQRMEAAWITESPPGGQLPQRAGFPSADGDVIERASSPGGLGFCLLLQHKQRTEDLRTFGK